AFRVYLLIRAYFVLLVTANVLIKVSPVAVSHINQPMPDYERIQQAGFIVSSWIVLLATYEQMKEQQIDEWCPSLLVRSELVSSEPWSDIRDSGAAGVSDFLLLGVRSNNFRRIDVHPQGAELQSQDGPG
uniref:Uncharacterized protein n=1 Tax=Aegilops tauschii subsp. strangulata TaxID=200361 RepID=A0A452YK32_AEGTS